MRSGVGRRGLCRRFAVALVVIRRLCAAATSTGPARSITAGRAGWRNHPGLIRAGGEQSGPRGLYRPGVGP